MRYAVNITVLALALLAQTALALDGGVPPEASIDSSSGHPAKPRRSRTDELDTDDRPASLPAGATQGSPTSNTEPDEEKPPELPADRAPTVKLTVEPTEASIGDPIGWRAVVKRRVGDRVHLPAAADFGDLEVQSRDREVGEPEDDWVEETLAITLLAFDTGEHEIPPQTLTVVDIEGRIAEIETDAAAVTIGSLIANEPEPELKPDTGPGEKVFEKDYTLLYVLAVIGGILVLYCPKARQPLVQEALEELSLERWACQLENQGVQLMQAAPWVRQTANVPWPQMPSPPNAAFIPTRA